MISAVCTLSLERLEIRNSRSPSGIENVLSSMRPEDVLVRVDALSKCNDLLLDIIPGGLHGVMR